MISIIIPTFNRVFLLKKAIESVLAQTYQDFELIVVDDGSTDSTPRLMSRFNGKVRYVRQNHKGPSAARNLGIRSCDRPFLAFLDSDDWWDRTKLGEQLKKMQEDASCVISHTQEVWYKDGRLLNQKKKHRKPQGHIFDKCLGLCVVSMSTVMIQRKVFDKVGLFDESLFCCEDYDFWLRASIEHDFLLIDNPLTLKDGGRPDQSSYIHRNGMDRFRIYSILKVINSGELSDGQRKSAINELRKKCKIYGNGCLKHGKIEEGRRYLDMLEAMVVSGTVLEPKREVSLGGAIETSTNPIGKLSYFQEGT